MPNLLRNIIDDKISTKKKLKAIADAFNTIDKKMDGLIEYLHNLKIELPQSRRESYSPEENAVFPEKFIEEETTPFIPAVDTKGFTITQKSKESKKVKKDYSKISDKLSEE